MLIVQLPLDDSVHTPAVRSHYEKPDICTCEELSCSRIDILLEALRKEEQLKLAAAGVLFCAL